MSAKWTGASDTLATSISFDDTLTGCNADPNARESVFRFDVSSPRRVRIDTEGSSFDTVLSLHDGPPIQSITRTDVSMNGVAPGYELGELGSKAYTVSDTTVDGTNALPSTYDFVQCGAAAAAKDAVFHFTLAKPTRIGLDVSSSGWDPIVGLFAATPGQATILTNGNMNDRVAAAGQDAFDVGNVLGQVSTRVNGSTLTGMTEDYTGSTVGCGAAATGPDQIFKFTPSGNTTVRIQASPSVANFYPVVSVFDGRPPTSTPPSVVQAYDASIVTLPETSGCQAFSYHDPGTGSVAPHVYSLCTTRRHSNDAEAKCIAAGMDHLAIIDTPAEQSFLASLVAGTSTTYGHHIGAWIPSGTTFIWRDGTTISNSYWASGEPNESSHKCVAMQAGGRWEDKLCTDPGYLSDDKAFYLCEDTNATVKPAEDLLTAQLVDPESGVVSVQGSTLRMFNDYNAAMLMAACGGTLAAGDAVFKVVTGASSGYTLSVDSAGSTYSPVLGLFEGTIDMAGYKACDAAGGAPLSYVLLPSRTYYIVVDGTAVSQEGRYKLKFANASSAASVEDGLAMSCGAGVSGAPNASVDVEVEGNHTYYFVVDSTAASTAVGAYTLQLSALYQARTTVTNNLPTNERGASAFGLPDPYRSKISVVSTSTSGMASDYANNVVCSAESGAPDAVYKLRPSVNTGLKITATPIGSGLATPVVGLFDGPPPTTPVRHDLAADGNTNDSLANAQLVSFGSSTQRYDGNTAALAADTDPGLAACGAAQDGRDAMFSFTLTEATQVEIDASASAMADPVLRLFKDGPRSRPAPTLLENDDRASANASPSPTPDLQDAWLHYSGDMAHLTSDAQVQSSVAASNSDGSAQDLLDLAGKRVTVGGADITALQADYPAACGAADSGKDALYTFTSSTATRLHVAAAESGGQNLALALYEGGEGPLRQLDLSSLTEDRSCVDAPQSAPRNLTRATLDLIAVDLASAVDVDLSCASPAISTTDPDGAGTEIVTFTGWCGPTPTAYVQTQAGGPDAVVLLMKSLRVQGGSTLRVTGDRPLIIVVAEDASIDGVLNASGDFSTASVGAGGGSCAGGDGSASGSRSGGGGGGGYGTAGGLGGASALLAGGSAGAVRGNANLVPLLGGCNGGKSGALGNSGRAGGAVQISALGTLSVSGQITANGSVGVIPSLSQHGGSGGGSGGAILVEAGKLSLAASALSVNGGPGTNGAGSGGAGGASSTSSSVAGGDGGSGSATSGGGGGGGGYGRIRSQERAISLSPCGPDGNEDVSSAAVFDVQSSGRTMIELGDLTLMQHDHDVTGCGAASDAHDAVYAFTLSENSDIRIDASGSPEETVIGLFDASELTAGKPALFCADKANGLTIKETLVPGDYRIVVSSLKTNGDKFDVRVQNMNYDAAKSTEVACDASGQSLQYDLKAGSKYYLLVKGVSAADSGSHGLYLETAGTGASLGCGASAGAADAVYKFHVASERAVSIDTLGSSMDTVLALYPSSATSFDTNYALDVNDVEVPCDATGSGTLSPRIDATLKPGDYYAVVKRKTLDWSTASQPYRISIRDGQTTSPLACASASIGGKKILQTLQPGDYRVVVSSETSMGGAYSVKFRDVSHFGLENGVQLACVSGAGNSLTYGNFEAGRDYYVVVKGSATSESGPYVLTVEDTVSLSAAAGSTAVACAAEGSSIDGVYPAGNYYALVSGASAAAGGNYMLRVQDLDTQNDENRLACNDDGGPNKTSAIETSLNAGTHYVVVKGKGLLDRGGYRLRVRDLDAVSDQRLVCAGDTPAGARFEYDVKANEDYTLILKGGASGEEGAYDLKMFDKVSAPSSMGSRLQCASDAQPSPLKNTDWDRDAMSFDTTLQGDKTYYVAVKGVRATDAGFFQLQLGDPNARTKATYTAPTWNTTRDALISSGVRVLPVIATKGDSGTFVPVAEAQAQMLAEASGATRTDGSGIWQRINKDGTGTGSGLVTAIAELAAHLAMDVSLTAVDGPDPGATRFKIDIAPLNSANCESPHPLVDAMGACTKTSPTQSCNTQYKCRPGAAPRFRVTFTNPATTPVPPNPDNASGGYLFKLQLKGDGKYLLDEIPVFLIPTTKMLPPPPGTYQSEGVYTQTLDALSCKEERVDGGAFEFNPRSTELPRWRDLFFKADVPDGASIDFELCTADTEAALGSCVWSEGGTRQKIVVTGGPDCSKDADCLNVPGKGNGFCSDFKTCQFITKPKVEWDVDCTKPSQCPTGPFGAGAYYLSSHCETSMGAYGYGHCVYHSVPVDIGSTLLENEDGKLFSKIRVKLHSNTAGNATPTLYEWYLTYTCQSLL
ncbi:MAG TPA: C-type lectin domain-containing protein [Polyangiales bacterium]|nr:C-type lectin domain-containing protein [Polyangiales bacterium]